MFEHQLSMETMQSSVTGKAGWSAADICYSLSVEPYVTAVRVTPYVIADLVVRSAAAVQARPDVTVAEEIAPDVKAV